MQFPVDVVEEAPTVDQFISIIQKYMVKHSKKPTRKVRVKTGEIDEKGNTRVDEQGKPLTKIVDRLVTLYTKTIVTLDHSILMKCADGQTRNDMLYAFGEAVTALKRKYPIIFIILSQLNRAIDNPERNEDGKYGNYILESDLFGADALLQHADLAMGLNRPGKARIKLYGPEKYIVDDDKSLVLHFLKSRNGECGMAFFEAAFAQMKIVERAAPPQQQSRIKI